MMHTKDQMRPASPPDHTAERIDWLLLGGLLLLLALLHLRAYWLGAPYQHFSDLAVQLDRLNQGLIWMPTGAASGGGPIYYWMHNLVLELGLPYTTYNLLFALLDGVGLVLWVLLARRSLPALLVWCVAFGLALLDIPKLNPLENSVMPVFILVPMFAALVGALKRRRPWGMWLPSLLLALSIHFSLVTIPAVAVMLLAIWWPPYPHRLKGTLCLAAGLILGLGHLVVVRLVSTRVGMPETQEAAIGLFLLSGNLWTKVGNSLHFLAQITLHYPLMVLGGAVTAGCWLRSRSALAPYQGLAAVWLVLALLPLVALQQGDIFSWYHLSGAAPAMVFFSGLGLSWLLNRVRHWRGEAWRPVRLLGVLVGASCAVAAVLTTLAGMSEGMPVPPRHEACPMPDSACTHQEIQASWAALEEMPAIQRGARPRFHGPLSMCLNGAWRWEHLRRGGEGTPSMREEAHQVLTMVREKPDGSQGLMLIPGVRPVTFRQYPRKKGGKEWQEVTVGEIGTELIYLSLIVDGWDDQTVIRSSTPHGRATTLAHCSRPIPASSGSPREGYLILDPMAGGEQSGKWHTRLSIPIGPTPTEIMEALQIPRPNATRWLQALQGDKDAYATDP